LQLEGVQPLDLPDFGDTTGAISAKLRASGVVFDAELVLVRVGSVGAVLMVARLEGDRPIVTLAEISNLLVSRILDPAAR
jgi:hypothetical protein